MPVQPFGKADPYYDALRVMSNQNIQGAALGDTGAGGVLENKIYLWPADGSTISTYDADSTGLTSALAAAVSGDTVWLPSMTISGDHTVPAGVALVGISREKSILTGQLTLTAAAIVISVAIIRSGTSANLTCLVGPGSGTARAVSCQLSVTTTSGTPLAASASASNTLFLEDCQISAVKNGTPIHPFGSSGSYTLVDTLVIDSTNASYQPGSYATVVGRSYRLDASGAVVWDTTHPTVDFFDAQWVTSDNWATKSRENKIQFSDSSTPVADDPTYNVGHAYSFTRPGTGAAFSARLFDGNYADNSGSITVLIYESPNATINTEGCEFDGAFSGIPQWGDRSAWDSLNFPARHANDLDMIGIHWTRDQLDSLYGGASLAWFNVKTYGAVGDGITDDTTAINDAITAIPAIGGVLYFPAGNYKVTSGLTLAKSITVRGDGSPLGLVEGPISKISFTSATQSLFTITSHGCSFKDIYLLNTAGSTPSAGAGLTVQAGNISNYDNVIVSRFYIDIDMQDDATVWSMNHCTLLSPILYALKIKNTSLPDGGDWNISNSSFVSATAADAAIRLESSGGGKIVNVKINSGAGAFVNGIDMAVTAGASTSILQVSNSSIENVSGDGIHLRNTTTSSWNQIIISDVQFGLYANTGGHAVSIVGVSASHFNDIIIEGCVFRATGSPGSAIDLQYVDAAYIGTYINDGFSSLLTTSNTTDIKQIGTGSGTVTSIAAGTGIALTPDPITTTGTVALNATLNNLSDVDTSGEGTGDIIYDNAGTWIPYPLGIGSKVTVSGTKIRFGNVAGGNYLEIDSVTGTLRLAGDATTYDDFRVEASVIKPGATAPNWKAFGPSGNLQALMFEASHDDEAYFELQMPHTWKLGTNLYPHVHWTPTDATAGNVVWQLEYAWANIGDAYGAPSTMATDPTAAGGVAWVHKLTDFKAGGNNYIDGTGKTLSSMLICRVHRNSNSGSDTLNKDVALLEIDFHYQIDSLGSDEPLVKDASASLLLETGDILLLESGDRLLLE